MRERFCDENGMNAAVGSTSMLETRASEPVTQQAPFFICWDPRTTSLFNRIFGSRKTETPATQIPLTAMPFIMCKTRNAPPRGGGLYLNYGACDEGEEAALEVAKDIVTQLEAHGLRTEWDGNWGQRIAVSLDWKRRQ